MWKKYSDGTYDGLKEDLERTYGVVILEEAIYSANIYIQTRGLFSYHETMEDKMRRVLTEACELNLSKVLKRMDEEDFDRLIYVLHRGFVERHELLKEEVEGCKYWLLAVKEELELAKWMFLTKFVPVSRLILGFSELVQKMDDISQYLYLALGTVDVYKISNLLSEFLELIHKFLKMIGMKYFHVMGVGDSTVQEVVNCLTGTPKEFEHEPSTLIENGVYNFEKKKILPPSKTLGRLLVRDVARSINARGMVVYPSEAVLNLLMFNDSIGNKNDYKRWLDEKLVPNLFKIAASCKVEDEIYNVYVDTLVGSSELSFRLEKESSKNIVENWFSKKPVGSLRNNRDMYRLEREVIDIMLKLKDLGYKLKSNVGDDTCISALKDLLILYRKSLSSMRQVPELGKQEPLKLINNRQTKAVKDGVVCLVRNMRDRLRSPNRAIKIMSLSILKSIKLSSNPPNKPSGIYLLAGLDNAGKIKLINDAAEHLRVSEGVPHLIHIDLSDKFWSQSLLFSATLKRNSEEPGFSIVEAVKKWPFCVIVFDNIEKADNSVYNTLLRILDTGLLLCVDGTMLDFRNTTVVLITDVGKRDLCLGLFGLSHQYYPGCSKDGIQQDGARFRTELLRRVDDVLCTKSKSPGKIKFFQFSKLKARTCLFAERGPRENKI